MLAHLHELLYREYVAFASTSLAEQFAEESRLAKAEYGRFGKLFAPWLRWRPERTLADMMRADQERRKDPTYMEMIRRIQRDVDAEAQRLTQAVEKELELRRLITARHEELEKKEAKRRRKRYGGFSARGRRR